MIKKECQIAELIGILLGDGSLSLREYNPTSINRLKITLNSKDDLEYVSYVTSLLECLFKTKPLVRFRSNENTVDILIFKKEVIKYVIEELGLKLSPKWNNAIIPQSYNSKELGLFVIRGYFDTDGCLVTTNNNGIIYPRLEMKVCPSPMQCQFIQLLKNYDFNIGVYQIGRGEVRIQMNGKKELHKWVKLIGFSNPKHSKKLVRFIREPNLSKSHFYENNVINKIKEN